MEVLWSLRVLVVLVSVDPACSHQSSGLSCLNDFVNKVSCVWNGSPAALGVNCSISGVIKTWKSFRHPIQMIRTCKLERRKSSPPGCSFVFENKTFSRYKDMPYIRMECDGQLVGNITNYKPSNHIKLHPPGTPSVNTTADEPYITWSEGRPLSIFITSFSFEIQITEKNQSWETALTLFTKEFKAKITSWKPSGVCRARVRVYPSDWSNGHWSDWSPTTSWVTIGTVTPPPTNQGWFVWGVLLSLGLILVGLMLVLYRSCVRKDFSLHKEKVPNPSKYFLTLHSVHGGNLKTWLNPLVAPDSFFAAQPCDHISPVQLCESSDGAPSSSPSSSCTSALLYSQSCAPADSDTSGVVDNSSSSSSSFFSNMGYFMSSSSGSSARTDPSPAYFTYQGEFHRGPNLHLSLCHSVPTTPTYESLKREPQSPDSGFGIGKEDEEDKEEKAVVRLKGGEVPDPRQTPPHLILPLHHVPPFCPPSSPPPSPNIPSVTQESSDERVDAPAAAAGGSYTAWPLSGAVCRSSSMPVEPCRTGYLTLKELQTTFSNKSI